MKVLIANLSDELYLKSRLRLNRTALNFGVNKIISWNFQKLKKTKFYLSNTEILSKAKGLGYWLWKPYIILEAMRSADDGDIILYSDCGIEIIADLTPLIDKCNVQEPILLFGNGNLLNRNWTKRDCFVLMDCDQEIFWNSIQCDAAFCLFKKCDLSIKFLNDWLNYSRDKRILTDLPNSCGLDDLEGFIEHRWDQSILSLLAQKYELNLYRVPSQFGNHYKIPKNRIDNEYKCVSQFNQNTVDYYFLIPYYNSDYGQLVNHHREKSHPDYLNGNDGVVKIGGDKSRKRAQPKGQLKSVFTKMSNKLKILGFSALKLIQKLGNLQTNFSAFALKNSKHP